VSSIEDGHVIQIAAAARWIAARKFTSGLVRAGCNGSELLKLAEEIVDQVSCLLQVLVIEPLVRAMAFRRYDRGFAGPG
jgi:hypothetical protein